MNVLFDFEFGLMFWQTILFLFAMFVLHKYAWTPILQIIEKKEKAYVDAAKRTEELRKITLQLESKSQSILERANQQSEHILQRALSIKKALLKEAKTEAEKAKDQLLTKAQQAILQEKKAALLALKQQVGLLAIHVAEKLLVKELNQQTKQENLLKKLVAEANLMYSTAT